MAPLSLNVCAKNEMAGGEEMASRNSMISDDNPSTELTTSDNNAPMKRLSRGATGDSDDGWMVDAGGMVDMLDDDGCDAKANGEDEVMMLLLFLLLLVLQHTNARRR